MLLDKLPCSFFSMASFGLHNICSYFYCGDHWKWLDNLSLVKVSFFKRSFLSKNIRFRSLKTSSNLLVVSLSYSGVLMMLEAPIFMIHLFYRGPYFGEPGAKVVMRINKVIVSHLFVFSSIVAVWSYWNSIWFCSNLVPYSHHCGKSMGY